MDFKRNDSVALLVMICDTRQRCVTIRCGPRKILRNTEYVQALLVLYKSAEVCALPSGFLV